MDEEKKEEIPQTASLPPTLEATRSDSVLVNLLKSPEVVANDIAEDKDAFRLSLWLLIAGLICHSAFGLAIGLFGGLSVGFMTCFKAPVIAFCSLVLCLPSLYVFSCVGGAPLTMKQTFMLGASCLAMIGFLLIGLAPVAWLFAVSTENLPFVVVLNLCVWLVAIGFVIRFITKLQHNELFQRLTGIKFWLLILALVSLQMVTSMRPILVKSEGSWWMSEKKFFIHHFTSCFEEEALQPEAQQNESDK